MLSSLAFNPANFVSFSFAQKTIACSSPPLQSTSLQYQANNTKYFLGTHLGRAGDV
jgi:hypothetical protein